MMKIKSVLHLSGRKLEDCGQLLKDELGLKLEPYFHKLVIDKGHEVDNFFGVAEKEFDCMEKQVDEKAKGKGKKKEDECSEKAGPSASPVPPPRKGKKKELKKIKKKVVYCLNVAQLVMFIKQKRGIDQDDDDLLFKIGLDSGRGFLKLCLTVEEKKVPGGSPDRKKTPQAKFRDSGVKRLIVLAIVEGASETYDSIKTLMELIDVDSLSFDVNFCLDLKMVNILMGKKVFLKYNTGYSQKKFLKSF